MTRAPAVTWESVIMGKWGLWPPLSHDHASVRPCERWSDYATNLINYKLLTWLQRLRGSGRSGYPVCAGSGDGCTVASGPSPRPDCHMEVTHAQLLWVSSRIPRGHAARDPAFTPRHRQGVTPSRW